MYGNLTFTPQVVTLTGMTPTNSNMAQITVKYKNNHSVNVTSTKTITPSQAASSPTGTTQTIATSGTSGNYKGSGSNLNKQIDVVWVKSGTNDSNNPAGSGERFEDNATTLKAYFGLTNVAYPYAGDTWDNYFNYVKTNTNVANAGYRKSYGYLNWVNYLPGKPRLYSQTPDLWKTSEQPISALKDSVDMFLNYLLEDYTGDRVGWAIYTSAGGTALVENQMTTDFVNFSNTIQHRQAGHYHSQTNIYDGMKSARLELQNNARVGAFKMMVLMTDGLPNLPGSGSNPTNQGDRGGQPVRRGEDSRDLHRMGSGADTSLDAAGGRHYRRRVLRHPRRPDGGAVPGAAQRHLEAGRRQETAQAGRRTAIGGLIGPRRLDRRPNNGQSRAHRPKPVGSFVEVKGVGSRCRKPRLARTNRTSDIDFQPILAQENAPSAATLWRA